MIEFKGPIAFAACFNDKGSAGLGVCEQDEPGYRPYEGASFETFEDAGRAADALNAKLGLTPREAALIIASTMRSGHYERRRLRAKS